MRIAFFGSPGCGKSTLSRQMAALYGGTMLSFASPLRKCVSQTFGIPIDDLMTVPEKYKWRQLLQFCGNRMRDVDANYWVDIMARTIDSHPPSTHMFLDDVRYPNEYDVLRQRGFEMVHVGTNPSVTSNAITADERRDSSEQHWRDFTEDYYVPWRHDKAMRVHSLCTIREKVLV